MIARLRELLNVANDPMNSEEYFPAVRGLFEALPALLDVVEAAKAMRENEEHDGKFKGCDTCEGIAAFDAALAALKRLEG
jgi:hypothetical protein